VAVGSSRSTFSSAGALVVPRVAVTALVNAIVDCHDIPRRRGFNAGSPTIVYVPLYSAERYVFPPSEDAHAPNP